VTTNGTMPPIAAWQVASMRVTAFPSEVVPTERLSSWWDDIVGVSPETVVSRPKVGQYQAQGEFEGRRLALQIQPGRIEWSVSPLVKVAEEDPDILVGPFPDVLASLSKVTVHWIPSAPALTRFAFGVTLVQPVESVRSGYVLIQRYLPKVVVDPDGSSDLFYQINRQRTSTSQIEGLRINRLSKWSVQIARRVTMTLGGDAVATRTLGEEVGCRLELDINTGQDFASALPAERLGALLQELSDLGSEIAQRGDIP
jgi:hypothetical protein